jgi:hypothetical protein
MLNIIYDELYQHIYNYILYLRFKAKYLKLKQQENERKN